MQFALEHKKNKTNNTNKKKQQQQQQQKLSKCRGILKITHLKLLTYLLNTYSLTRIQRERTMQIENLIFFTVFNSG